MLDTLSKIFTAVLNKRLITCAGDLYVISEEQAGFQQGSSTIDNIFTFQSVIQKYIIKRRDKLYCAFIDFSKAFYSVNRQKLLYVLIQKGGQE